jgi:hypothetical protein
MEESKCSEADSRSASSKNSLPFMESGIVLHGRVPSSDKPPAFTLVSCSAYFSTLKMEAICSSETSVDTQLTTRRYIPEDGTLHNHCCENLKSYIVLPCSQEPSTELILDPFESSPHNVSLRSTLILFSHLCPPTKILYAYLISFQLN